MIYSLDVFLLAAPAVLLAGISKGGFGGGAGFVATLLIALVLPPAEALGLMLPLLMVADMTGLRAYWGKWSVVDMRRMLIGTVPGLLLGVLLYRLASADALRLLIGALAIGFVAFQLARGRGMIRPARREPGTAAGIIAGMVAAFTSFVSHAGGPPAAIYFLSRKISKTAYQSTTVVVFSVINAAKVIPYGFLGIFTPQTLTADAILAPVMLAGTLLGVWAHRRISETLFFRVTYVLLFAAGVKLIWDALT